MKSRLSHCEVIGGMIVVLAASWVGAQEAQSPVASPSARERLAASGRVKVHGFEGEVLGVAPAGWRQGVVGEGNAEWRIVEDGTNRVLAQIRGENPNRQFNVIWSEADRMGDGELTVRLRAVSGRHDQGGGLVWRLRDERNYYVARFNPLEGNVVLYKMENGVRIDLPLVEEGRTYGKPVAAHPEGWHTLAVRVEGDLFSVALNGRPLFQVRDATFSGGGAIGLWTKADAVSWFDDLRVEVER